eukprot:COSAG01_NODE_3692_length_5789_cov_4.628295_10_plen_236_part_00
MQIAYPKNSLQPPASRQLVLPDPVPPQKMAMLGDFHTIPFSVTAGTSAGRVRELRRGWSSGQCGGSSSDSVTAGRRPAVAGSRSSLRIWLEQAAVFQNVCCSIITYQQVSISKRTAPHWECRTDRCMCLSGPGGLAGALCSGTGTRVQVFSVEESVCLLRVHGWLGDSGKKQAGHRCDEGGWRLSEPARGFSVLATDGDQSPPVNFQAGMQQPGILQPAEADSLMLSIGHRRFTA